MKKQQTKDLEDEFSNLFLGNPQPNQKSKRYASNEIEAPQFSSVTFKQVDYTESQSEEDFVDQVDEILRHGQQRDQMMTRQQMLLNYKMNELNLVCKNLRQANKRLAERVEELERPRSEIMDNASESNRSVDLTLMQQDFIEIQQQLSSYKQQLANYQRQTLTQLAQKNEEISKYRRQLIETRQATQRFQKQLREKDRIISLLQKKNQELVLAIEEIETLKQRQDEDNAIVSSSRKNNFMDSIETEMETMIDKLLKQLKFQKKNSTKQITEIKRLNGEIIELESKLKQKTNKVYDLEMALIKKTKQSKFTSPLKEKSPHYKQENYQVSSSNYLPPRAFLPMKSEHESSKNKSQLGINKNRISAEREGVEKGSSNLNYGLLKLNKLFSSFTLMDLLNKQFKIRMVEKYIIICRVMEVYARKIMQESYANLIPEDIEICNFNSQSPGQLRVKVSTLNKSDHYQANEESMLYNMAFILNTLLDQVEVVDAYQSDILELNIPECIDVVLSKQTKDEKHKVLLEMAKSIEQSLANRR